jgi:hypothetical protein
VPVEVSSLKERLPNALLTVLLAGNPQNDSGIATAIYAARGKPVVFLYLAEPGAKRAPRLFEVVDPYLDDQPAKETLKHAALLAREAGLPTRFVYRQQEPEVTASLWHTIRPHDVVLAAEDAQQCAEINPDLIRYELTSQGKIASLLKHRRAVMPPLSCLRSKNGDSK